MTASYLRQLIWIPIVHNQADLGTMGDAVRQLQIRRIGRLQWEKHCKTIDESWAGIRRQVEELNLPWQHVRLYQDGLANCGRELEIVQSLAGAGSLNHQLLLELVKKGATLVGTESRELLLEEYELAGQLLESMSVGGRSVLRREKNSQALLKKRDRYIAERIERTLGIGEIGLLFLGMLHALAGLPGDIEVLRRGLVSSPRSSPSRSAKKGARK